MMPSAEPRNSDYPVDPDFDPLDPDYLAARVIQKTLMEEILG